MLFERFLVGPKKKFTFNDSSTVDRSGQLAVGFIRLNRFDFSSIRDRLELLKLQFVQQLRNYEKSINNVARRLRYRQFARAVAVAASLRRPTLFRIRLQRLLIVNYSDNCGRLVSRYSNVKI
jgi:hypothetical protein